MSFLATHLSGFGAGGAAASTATISYRTQAENAAGTTTTTFSSQSVGTAASDRYVVVAVGSTGTSATVSSVTVGGASTTQVVTSLVGARFIYLFITTAAFTSGTTANIVVTTAAAPSEVVVGVWALYGLASNTAVSTQTSTTNSGSMNLTLNNGGVVVSAMVASAVSATQTGTTERFDTTVGGSARDYSGGDASTSASSLSVAYTANATIAAICAAWS